MSETLMPEATPAEEGQSPEPNGEFDFNSLLGEDGSFRSDLDWRKALSPLGEQAVEKSQAISRYKNPGELLKGMAHMSSLVGKKMEGVKPLTPESSEDEIARYREVMGVPETVEGYKVEAPEGVDLNKDVIAAYLPIFHQHNAPQSMVQALVNANVELERAKAEKEAGEAQIAAETHLAEQTKILDEAWGSSKEGNLLKAQRGAMTIGLDPKDEAFQDFFRSAAFVQAMFCVADMIAEDKLIDGNAVSAPANSLERARDIIHGRNGQEANSRLYHSGDEATMKLVADLMKRGQG